jgi:hypothetical protein
MTLHKIGRNLAPAVVLSVAKDLIAACYGHEILRCAQDDGKNDTEVRFIPVQFTAYSMPPSMVRRTRRRCPSTMTEPPIGAASWISPACIG